MSFPAYPKYKNSGVEWLGPIPEHWKPAPYKLLLDIQNGADHKLVEQEEGYPVFGSGGLFAHASDYLYDGESVLLGRKGTIDKPLYVSGKFWTVDTMYWSKIEPGVFAKFAYYAALTIPFDYYSTNTALPSMTKSVLGNHAVAFPPYEEQVTIATFLDHETVKIDALIKEQERLIEFLLERQSGFVSKLVTRGLKGGVEIVNSGVGWLGEVPSHWKVLPIKRIVETPITDGPHETPEFVESGIPFVSAEAVSTGVIDFGKIRGFITESEHRRYSQKYKPRRDDIFMVKSGATTGVSAIVDTDKDFNIWSPLAVIRCGPTVLPRFALHFIRSKNFKEAVQLGWSFGTQQNIGMGVIENLSITVPPIEEQAEIVRALDGFGAKVDDLIRESREGISLLGERKSALISAAVTGKIDVRGFVAPTN